MAPPIRKGPGAGSGAGGKSSSLFSRIFGNKNTSNSK